MPPNLERSPEIQEQIDTIRAMSQGFVLKDTPENRERLANKPNGGVLYGIEGTEKGQEVAEMNAAKKIEAKLLRQELMWDNAFLMKKSFDLIAKNPDITADELYQECLDTGKVLNPDVLAKFNETLSTRAQETRLFWSSIQDNARYHGVSPEIYVYQSLIPESALKGVDRSSFIPKGPVKINLYPLAVEVEVSPGDFSLINPQKNVGGFYNSEHTLFESDSSHVNTGSIVVIRHSNEPGSDSHIYRHERGHAHQNIVEVVKDSMDTRDKELADSKFLNSLETSYQKLSSVNTTEEMAELYTFDTEVREGVQALLSYCEKAASDELLAEKNTNAPLSSYLGVLRYEDIYDYVSDALEWLMEVEEGKNKNRTSDTKVDTHVNSQVRDFLSNLYITQLYEDTRNAISLDKFYNQVSPERVQLLREALRLIPITKWNKYLEDSLCMEELEEWESTQNMLNEIHEQYKNVNYVTEGKFKYSDEAKKLLEDLVATETQIELFKEAIDLSPMYKDLLAIKEQVEDLSLKVADLPEFQVMSACSYVTKFPGKVGRSNRNEFISLRKEFGAALVTDPNDPNVILKYKKMFQETFI